MNTEKMTNQLLKEERIAYKQALAKRKQSLKESKKSLEQRHKKEAKSTVQPAREKIKSPAQRLKEEKRALEQYRKEEKRALKNKQDGKNYVLSDFDFTFKRSPKYQKEFREVEVKYLYRDQAVTYYLFVRKNLNNQEALESAKNQIKNLIKTGEIRRYAKYFCRAVY